jgi:hypothetical protein
MDFKHLRLSDIADQAPGHGVDSLESRPARTELGAQDIGLTSSGSGRFKVDQEIVEVAPGEVVYCPPQVMREWEAGNDGLEIVAFGGHAKGDGNMQPGWWTD